MRNSGKINEQLMFKFYLESGGDIKNFNEFRELFYIDRQKVDVMGHSMYNEKERDLGELLNNLDKKFEVTTLWSLDGEFLKAIE
jgi:hypothetical protein